MHLRSPSDAAAVGSSEKLPGTRYVRSKLGYRNSVHGSLTRVPRSITSLFMYPDHHHAPPCVERRASRLRRHGRPRSRSDGACTGHRRLRPASGAILVAAAVLVAVLVGKGAKCQKDGGLGLGRRRRGVSSAQAVLEFQSLYPFPSATGVSGLNSTVLIGMRANGEIELAREPPGGLSVPA
ncbi:hypothetical protein F5Y01DRAFT_318038 [Xylaria sp. FL0043]|nr:hypothetical protein F5Y01DRAFT_318038 [Xylaria sp. FL0043]